MRRDGVPWRRPAVTGGEHEEAERGRGEETDAESKGGPVQLDEQTLTVQGGIAVQEKTVDRWLSIRAVCETLDCGDKYVYFLIQQGSLKAMKLGERALRVSEQSLRDFIESRIVNPADYFAPQDANQEQERKRPVKVAKPRWMDR